MQRDLAGLGSRGGVVIATRSHYRIAEDEPALVAGAIDKVVDVRVRPALRDGSATPAVAAADPAACAAMVGRRPWTPP